MTDRAVYAHLATCPACRTVVGTTVEQCPDPGPALTHRQLEILQLLADGCSTKEVAARLWVTHETVRTHLAHAFRALDVHGQAAAVARCLRAGVIE